jgi:hypothetical protein
MGKSSFLWLACLTLVGLGIGYAQESGNAAPVDTSKSELAYFLEQQDANKATGSKLQAQMDELQKKYAADSNAGLREQILEHEAFETELQNLRNKAPKFTNPILLPALDWLVRDAQRGAKNLQTELNARLRTPNTDQIALKSQIDKLQREIDLNNKMAKTLADQIKSIQDDHRRDGVSSELDALAKMAGGGTVSATGPTVVHPDWDKEH